MGVCVSICEWSAGYIDSPRGVAYHRAAKQFFLRPINPMYESVVVHVILLHSEIMCDATYCRDISLWFVSRTNLPLYNQTCNNIWIEGWTTLRIEYKLTQCLDDRIRTVQLCIAKYFNYLKTPKVLLRIVHRDFLKVLQNFRKMHLQIINQGLIHFTQKNIKYLIPKKRFT